MRLVECKSDVAALCQDITAIATSSDHLSNDDNNEETADDVHQSEIVVVRNLTLNIDLSDKEIADEQTTQYCAALSTTTTTGIDASMTNV